jgi:quinol monooxygenase YgiN
MALFIRHRAQPGRRDDVRRIWEKYVKPRVETNPAHEVYYFCYDQNDPEVICVFQLYPNEAAMKEFLGGAWYPEYVKEISEVVVGPPIVAPAELIWNKAG